jgi:predicted outer membrane repeat protein
MLRVLVVALLAFGGTVAVFVAGEAPRAGATTIVVIDEAQYRQALASLSSDPNGPHTIVIGSSFTIDDGTDPVYNGTASLSIVGNGNVLDAAGSSRILAFDSSASLTVSGLVLAEGQTSGDGGAIDATRASSVTVSASAFLGNQAGGDGGALAGPIDGRTSIDRSVFENNSAASGGALSASDLDVRSSTFASNRAGDGGAIILEGGDLHLVNTTIAANAATNRGGGMWLVAQGDPVHLSLTYVTMAGNEAPNGASILTLPSQVAGFLATVSATVVADPHGDVSCRLVQVQFLGGDDNFTSDDSCGFPGAHSVTGGDPRLEALANSGSRLPTMDPAPTSPLVDAVPLDRCPVGINTDERDFPRPSGPGCDIGAVEVQATGLGSDRDRLGEPQPRFTG